MQEIEERWQRIMDAVGLVNATRLIMAKNPGQGDSVTDLDSLWQDKTVLQIYETILAEKSVPTQVAEPWSEIRAGGRNTDTLTLLPGDEWQEGDVMTSLLALDPGLGITGWAVFYDGELTTHGIFRPRGKTLAARLGMAYRWCWEMLDCHGATHLALETLYLPHTQERRNVKSLIHRARLDGAYMAAAGQFSVQVVEVVPAERLNAVGLKGNLSRDAAKAQVLYCINAQFGLELTSYDVADAIAIGVAAMGKIAPQVMVEEMSA